MILAGGPFMALPPTMGRHRDDRRAGGAQRLAQAWHRQDRVDAEPGVRGADDDAGEVGIGQRGERLGVGSAPGRAVEADGAHRRAALLAHEVVLELERAGVGLDHGAHAARRHRQDARGQRRAGCEVRA